MASTFGSECNLQCCMLGTVSIVIKLCVELGIFKALYKTVPFACVCYVSIGYDLFVDNRLFLKHVHKAAFC